MRKRRITAFIVTVIAITTVLLAGCSTAGSPGAIEETFGGPGRVEIARSQEVGIPGVEETREEVQELLLWTCGRFAQELGVQAGCYGAWNASQIPPSGGSCITSSDCPCCFLYGVPASAADGLVADLLAGREVTGPTIEHSVQPVVPSEERRPTEEVVPKQQRKPLIPREGVTWPLNRGLKVTGGLVVLLGISIVLIETELLGKGTWFTFAAILYTVLFGILITHLWGFLVPFELPILEGEVKTGAWLAFMVVWVIAGYLVKSEQVQSQADVVGYSLLFLVGFGLHWVFALGNVLPITIIL